LGAQKKSEKIIDTKVKKHLMDGAKLIQAESVLHYAYGFDNPSVGGSDELGDYAQNASLAWGEGWGTGLMLALRPDSRYYGCERGTGFFPYLQ
jgi:hypothetical protein